MRERSSIVRPLSPPSAWVSRHVVGLRPGGCVLDVACGRGRHFPPALEAGCTVIGIDRGLVEARSLWGAEPRVELIAADLETDQPAPWTPRRFAGVIVTRYLWRPLLPAIVDAVAPDGLLIYETFMVGQERFGQPNNPEFLLRPGELRDVVGSKLHIVRCEEGEQRDPRCVISRIVGVGAAHPWANGAPQPI